MLALDYRWEELWGGQALYLDGVMPYPYRCGYWSAMPGGGGVLVHWGVRDCLPNQRFMATPEGATRFIEAWAIKWDAEIRTHLRQKGQEVHNWHPPSAEVAQEAARRDLFRRRGHRKDWWKNVPPVS